MNGATWTRSADGKTYTIDSDLAEFKAQGTAGPGPEHLKGTVTCP